MLESLFNKVVGFQACNFIKKRLAQMFPCEACEIFKNRFFYRATPKAASVRYSLSVTTDIGEYIVGLKCIQNVIFQDWVRVSNTFCQPFIYSIFDKYFVWNNDSISLFSLQEIISTVNLTISTMPLRN